MTLYRLWTGALHVVIFIAGLRMLCDAHPTKLDVMLLAFAGLMCAALLFQWRRTPEKFGHDPQLAAQLLVHGLAIVGVALATRALAWFVQVWNALTAAAVVAAFIAAALASARFQSNGEALWRYGRMALASVALMALMAAGILWFGQRTS